MSFADAPDLSPPTERAQVELRSGRFVSLVATVNLTRGLAKILYVNRVGRAMVPTVTPQDRRASLRVSDARDRVLGEYPVWVREDTDIPTGEDRTALIDAVIPDLPGTGSIELVLSGRVVDRVRVTKNAPVVKQVRPSPPGKDAPSGTALILTWAGSDADSEYITYMVQISMDGGKTWETLAIGLTKPELAMTTDQLKDRQRGVLRVIANDGFNSSRPVTVKLRALSDSP